MSHQASRLHAHVQHLGDRQKKVQPKPSAVRLARDFVSRSLVESERSQQIPHLPTILKGPTVLDTDVACETEDWSKFPIPGDVPEAGFLPTAVPVHLKKAPPKSELKKDEQSSSSTLNKDANMPRNYSNLEPAMHRSETDENFGGSQAPSVSFANSEAASVSSASQALGSCEISKDVLEQMKKENVTQDIKTILMNMEPGKSSPGVPFDPLKRGYSPLHKPQRARSVGDQEAATTAKRKRKGGFRNVGLVICGDPTPAAGTHNVILGLLRFLTAQAPNSKLYGFLNGPAGLYKRRFVQIQWDDVGLFLNQGGADMLGYGMMKRMSELEISRLKSTIEFLELDGLVFIAGPLEMSLVSRMTSQLASEKDDSVTVVGVFQSPNANTYVPSYIPVTLGFDSARGVLSELAGNVVVDCVSSKRFYHFVRCPSATLTMEVVLRIRPCLYLVTKELQRDDATLVDVVKQVTDVVSRRYHQHGKHSGIIFMSDDLLEKLPGMEALKCEIERIRKVTPDICNVEDASLAMSEKARNDFNLLPDEAKSALVFRIDREGRPLLIKLDPAELLAEQTLKEITHRHSTGQQSVPGFEPRVHAMGQEARCPLPTPFDSHLGWALGNCAGALLKHGASGYAACVTDLDKPVSEWGAAGYPFAKLMSASDRTGGIPLMQKVELELTGGLFKIYQRVREIWRDCSANHYCQPGPVQFHSKGEFTNQLPYKLLCEYNLADQLVETVEPLINVPRPLPNSRIEYTTGRTIMVRSRKHYSILQVQRLKYNPRLPGYLNDSYQVTDTMCGRMCASIADLSAALPSASRVKAAEIIPVDTGADTPIVFEMLDPREADAECKHVLSPILRDAPDVFHIESDSCAESSASNPLSPSHKPIVETVPNETQLVRAPDRRTQHYEDREFNKGESGKSPNETSGETSGESKDLPPPQDLPPRETSKDQAVLPMKVGVVFLGRPSPAVHNVVIGLFDYLMTLKPRGELHGFVGGGKGLENGWIIQIERKQLSLYLNQGGVDLLGRSQSALGQGESLLKCAKVLKKHQFDGLVVIGGVGTHADTALLAEICHEMQVPTRVLGVPASVQSDIPLIEQSVGFDTAAKVFGSIVGNLAADAASSKKNWYFVRISGYSSSHIAAECMLQCHPQLVILSEEVAARRMDLSDITNNICEVVVARAEVKRYFGVVLIPDGLLAHVPEMRTLVREIDELCTKKPALATECEASVRELFQSLTPISQAMLKQLPEKIQRQIFFRKSEGLKVDIPNIDTEVLFMSLVESELARRKALGTFHGSFQAQPHSLAYQGRGALPSNFDCDLGYTLGYGAGVLLDAGKTALLVHVRNLSENINQWRVGGVPLSSLVNVKYSNNDQEVVIWIESQGLMLVGKRFQCNLPPPAERRFVNPGPVQFVGPSGNARCRTNFLHAGTPTKLLMEVSDLCWELQSLSASACGDFGILQAVISSLTSTMDILSALKGSTQYGYGLKPRHGPPVGEVL
eukprot:gene1285-163_t